MRRLVGASLSLWLSLGLVGTPPPFVRVLVGALLPVAVPVLFAPVLRALSREVAVLPPALFNQGHPYCLLLGTRVPLVRRPAGVLLPFAPLILLAHLLCSLFV